jgi:hypothetical protein
MIMTESVVRKSVLIALISFAGLCVRAELQTWTLLDEKTFEAELITVFPDQVIFKDVDGQTLKIPFDRFTPESQTQIELSNTPKLSVGIIKDNESIVFPAGMTVRMQRPPEIRCNYGARVKQTSRGDYNHELNVELFVIGRERNGKKYILLDRQNRSFMLTKDQDRQFEFRSEHKVILQNYSVDESVRGEKYFGYLAIVKDSRGETIAVDSSHQFLLENLENLRDRYTNNFMDETCNRVYPTPAPVYTW